MNYLLPEIPLTLKYLDIHTGKTYAKGNREGTRIPIAQFAASDGTHVHDNQPLTGWTTPHFVKNDLWLTHPSLKYHVKVSSFSVLKQLVNSSQPLEAIPMVLDYVAKEVLLMPYDNRPFLELGEHLKGRMVKADKDFEFIVTDVDMAMRTLAVYSQRIRITMKYTLPEFVSHFQEISLFSIPIVEELHQVRQPVTETLTSYPFNGRGIKDGRTYWQNNLAGIAECKNDIDAFLRQANEIFAQYPSAQPLPTQLGQPALHHQFSLLTPAQYKELTAIPIVEDHWMVTPSVAMSNWFKPLHLTGVKDGKLSTCLLEYLFDNGTPYLRMYSVKNSSHLKSEQAVYDLSTLREQLFLMLSQELDFIYISSRVLLSTSHRTFFKVVLQHLGRNS